MKSGEMQCCRKTLKQLPGRQRQVAKNKKTGLGQWSVEKQHEGR
jgi:hypothetical protein